MRKSNFSQSHFICFRRTKEQNGSQLHSEKTNRWQFSIWVPATFGISLHCFSLWKTSYPQPLASRQRSLYFYYKERMVRKCWVRHSKSIHLSHHSISVRIHSVMRVSSFFLRHSKSIKPSKFSILTIFDSILMVSLKTTRNSFSLFIGWLPFYKHFYSFCFWTLEGIAVLSSALKENQALTHLELRGNSIRSDGAKLIANALKINNTLTSLNLHGTFH